MRGLSEGPRPAISGAEGTEEDRGGVGGGWMVLDFGRTKGEVGSAKSEVGIGRANGWICDLCEAGRGLKHRFL